MEGKEPRFGQAEASLFAAATTGTGAGAANATCDSMTPGGGGTRLYDMLSISIVAVFIAGLMVGRTPEYLGNKIEAREMKHVTYAILVALLFILDFSMVSAMAEFALDGLGNSGPHGLTEIVYAYAATASDNGSAFGGLTANAPWFNTSTGIAMSAGRSCMASRSWRSPDRRRQRRARRPRRGLSRLTGPCSSVCRSASSSSSGSRPISRRWRSARSSSIS